MNSRFGRAILFLFLLVVAILRGGSLLAQGVTTGNITGVVTDAQQQPVPGTTVTAVHIPSGTTYVATTNTEGRFLIPGMRVGGPYTVTATLPGFQTQVQDNITLSLGVAQDIVFSLKVAGVQESVTVTAESDPIMSSERTGAATSVSRETLAALPSVSQRLQDIVRLTPQYGGNMSFAGQDTRMNNITVDGAYFNNSFGLRNTPGDTSGVAPISLDAIEQIQVNIAPYDVRQGNFVGASVNTVTRSGSNQIRGSAYRMFRNESMVGTQAKSLSVNPGTFSFGNTGGWAAGPIKKNKLFFFVNYENESLTQPGTTYQANPGGQPVAGNVTRVLASDLDALSSFLQSRFNYETGPYQGYDFAVPAKRFLLKTDYNVSDRNKLVFRYNQLDSSTDQLVSNSSSLGFGNRRTRLDAINFQRSNYQILENIRSGIGELNTVLGSTMSNNLIVGYTHQDESRGFVGEFFPFVDILKDGATYTSFGFEPFTPNNELRYNTFQLQDNFTRFGGKHSQTFGASYEKYRSENVFFSGAQSVYVYNSLEDFYTDANDALGNPNRTVSPVDLRRFQVSWNNIPGQDKPVQPLDVTYAGVYAQDDWAVARNLKVVMGLRLDVPFFAETGNQNPLADAMTFRDRSGNPVQYQTAKLPDPKVLWSPRMGFNWDVAGNRNTQLRGGSGIFTGRPAYVWISNQIGTTGVLTGSEQLDNTRARPFNPNPDRYKPATVTGAPASSYALALTEQDFRFPQTWRTDIGVDHRLPWGVIGTAEFLYNRDVNGVRYINANLPAPTGGFAGPDGRARYLVNRINSNVSSAVVLQNQNVGRSWNLSGSASKTLSNGFLLKAAYSYGEARNTVDPGSIALGSWNNNPHTGDPNNPALAYSSNSPGHRVFVAAAYSKELFQHSATSVSVFWEGRTIGNDSYTFSGDLNGDGGTSNDLIYVPRDTSEMNFQQYTAAGRIYTAAEQAQAWEAYIQADDYLSKRRGQYAERGGVFLPMVRRMDLSIGQEIFASLGGARNAFQVRLNIQNVGNLLNKNWGVSQRIVLSSQPLIVPTGAQGGPVDAQGRAQYRLRTINNELITTPLESTATLSDVYRMQISLRYSFR
ncbi:MAG: carboxypeptidase regulatory-like domain-containing protein [Acidobacteriota bacterium]|nr:carboxypeptidase regulatory-like domain-containing protein [Acidobacteriota bacterium]